MKKLFTIAICLSCIASLFGQAQDVDLQWGPLLKTKNNNFNRIIGNDENYFYSMGQEGRTSVVYLRAKKDLYITQFSRADHTKQREVKIDAFEYSGDEASPFKAWILNGTINVFYTAFNSKEDQKFLLLRQANMEGDISEPIVLGQINTSKRHSQGKFDVRLSSDSSKVLVHFDLPYQKGQPELFALKVFDTNFKELWRKEVSLPYRDKYFEVKDYSLSNNGDVFVIGYAKPDRSKGEKRKRKESNEFYKIFKVSSNVDDFVEYDLSLDDKFIDDLGIRTDLGENLIGIAGLYSEKKRNLAGGSFFITLEQSSFELKTKNFREFTTEFRANFMSERKAKKGRDISNFVFRNFIRRKDGGAVIVAERYFVVTTTSTIMHANGGSSMQTTTTYHYNNIMVLNINPDGTIEWASQIPKYQSVGFSIPLYVSYMVLVDEDRLHFIYNDHRKNLERKAKGKDIKSMGSLKKSVAVISTVDANGEVSYDQLFSNKDFNAILDPSRSYQIDDSEVIIFGVKGKKSRFGTIKFQ